MQSNFQGGQAHNKCSGKVPLLLLCSVQLTCKTLNSASVWQAKKKQKKENMNRSIQTDKSLVFVFRHFQEGGKVVKYTTIILHSFF